MAHVIISALFLAIPAGLSLLALTRLTERQDARVPVRVRNTHRR